MVSSRTRQFFRRSEGSGDEIRNPKHSSLPGKRFQGGFLLAPEHVIPCCRAAVRPRGTASAVPSKTIREGFASARHWWDRELGSVIHQHDPHPGMAWSRRANEIRRQFAPKIAIVERRRVVRIENLRAEPGIGGIPTGAQREENFVGHAGLRDVKEDGVSGPGMVENEVGGGSGGVPPLS